mmetsp:Transcript_40469/g.53087  ORF Transcript_40469/g.53087 Transcript_40469/m.53087 type:complete len:90 (-) Transcript_40469:1299-1568(-)
MGHDEAREKKIRENEFIAAGLRKQLADKQQAVRLQKKEQSEQDQKYLSGWGSLKDAQGTHYATGGNVGKMAGPTRQAFLQKEQDEVAMK